MNGTSPKDSAVVDPRISFFNDQAATWDKTGPDPAATLSRLQEVKARLGLGAGQHVFEIGCGTGQITGWVADIVKPGKVVASDFAPAMLERARRRGVEAEFVLMDICREEPVERQFDVVLCFHSFPHFRDQKAALRQIARLLKPGGQLLVVHLVGSRQLNAFHHHVGGAVCHDHLPHSSAWKKLLLPVGMRIAEAVDQEDLFLVRAILGSQLPITDSIRSSEA